MSRRRTIRCRDTYEALGLRWIHGLVSEDLDYGGVVYRLSDRGFFDAVFASLRAQIEGDETTGGVPVFQPAYVHEHNDRGTDVPPTQFGVVRAVRKLSAAEAAAQGLRVDPSHEQHIVFGVELNRVGLELDERDQLPYASVQLEFDYDDHARDGGRPRRDWAGWMHELSTTVRPYVKRLQHASQTRQLSLAERPEEGPMTTEELMAAIEQLDEDARTELLAKLAPMTTADPDMPDDEEDDDAPKLPVVAASEGRVQLAELRAKVAAVEASNQSLRADLTRREIVELCDRERIIVRDDKGALNEQLVDDLLAVRLADAKRFDRLVQTLPRDSREPGRRAARSGSGDGEPASISLSDPDASSRWAVHERASELAKKENIKLSEALRRLHG